MDSESTIAIIGLGNPGDKYQRTRHNIGFVFLDWILEKNSPDEKFKSQRKFDSEMALTQTGTGARILLAKPQTFMNRSGFATRKILDFHKLSQENLVVVHDDLDLPFGTIRISKNSGAAGHNGVASVIEQLGTKDFIRLRIGISNDFKDSTPSEKFVLDDFSSEEQEEIEKNLLPKMEQALNDLLKKGFTTAANIHN